MLMAVEEARHARLVAPPNPWVGALIVDDRGVVIARGHTEALGGNHAEVSALHDAGDLARGASMVVTLEPCVHVGRTGPCVEAIVEAGIRRVVVAMVDPDPRMAGQGINVLRASGVDVEVGVQQDAVRDQLAAYLWQRTTGRPYVVAKVAATLDGAVAMNDGTSRWITGEEARRDAHRLRAESQAIIVGAGTVRTDDPALTARLGDRVYEPLRVVLGHAPLNARARPCWEREGPLEPVLDELGADGVLQALVEGGPTTVSAFLAAGLVNRLVWYLAPAWAGRGGTLGAVEALTTPTIDALRRGRLVGVVRIGEDVRMDVEV
jgi:diaminohydroxyphosphoribosylaminopyrimidine deaminase/5-amino-6-(5-phosphoribosylamino)uracil reductase